MRMLEGGDVCVSVPLLDDPLVFVFPGGVPFYCSKDCPKTFEKYCGGGGAHK